MYKNTIFSMLISTLLCLIPVQVFASHLAFFNYGRYEALSKKLFDADELDTKSHSVLKRNVIYYLKNYLDTDQLKEISQHDQEQMLESIYQRNFWSDKLERDLSIPYNDADFKSYMDALQLELSDFISYMKALDKANSQYKLYVFGSMSKGRFGANSSLDIFLESDDRALLRKVEEGPYSKFSSNFRGNIEITTSSFGARFLLDPLVKVDLDGLEDLIGLYQGILVGTGFQMIEDGASLHIKEDGDFQRIPMEFNPIEDRVFYLLKKTFLLQQEARTKAKSIKTKEGIEQRQDFLARSGNLQEDFKEVAYDLRLIVNRVDNARHERIREVISPPSYQRLATYRSKKLLRLVEMKLDELEDFSMSRK